MHAIESLKPQAGKCNKEILGRLKRLSCHFYTCFKPSGILGGNQ